MKPFSRLVVVLALALAAGACSEQPPCEALPCPLIPAVTLTVRDAMDGGPIADPVANGLPCGSAGLCIPRLPDAGTIGVGTSAIDVTAPGHGHVQLDVTVPSATQPSATRDPCSCQLDYVPQTRDVSLPPS